MSDLIEQFKELIDRLKSVPSGVGLGLQDRQLLDKVAASIRELEATVLSSAKLADAYYIRAEKAEAEQGGLMKCVIELKAERAALEAATIERCAQVVEGLPEG